MAYFLISVLFLFPILRQDGFPFKYDWGWPLFDFSDFWIDIYSIKSLLNLFSKNAVAFLGLSSVINISPLFALKLFLILVHTFSGYFMYRFLRNQNIKNGLALVGGIIYSFSPYIFIRTITGFIFALFSYALVPLFLNLYFSHINSARGKFWAVVFGGIVFSLICAQIQIAVLLLLVVIVDLLFWEGRQKLFTKMAKILIMFASFLSLNLYWIIVYLKGSSGPSVGQIGSSSVVLSSIANLPHSLRNVLMLSDHHITKDFFYALARDPLYYLGFVLVIIIVALGLINKKHRRIGLVFALSSLLIMPFSIGPTGVFSKFYILVFDRLPQLALFRETYHFEFSLTLSLSVLFVFGLEYLFEKIDRAKFKGGIKVLVIKTVAVGSTLFIVAPYLTFCYAGYFPMQKFPDHYQELYQYLNSEEKVCEKIFYPPNIGFIYFKDDKSLAAINSDLIARSMGVRYLTDGSSVLDLPTDEMFYRNELTSQFLESEDYGKFFRLMQEGQINCLIVRTDIDTKYDQVSNLWRDPDTSVRKKWLNSDMLSLARGKAGLEEVKRFGEKIFIFKMSNDKLQINNIELFPTNGKPPTTNYLPITKYLPLTDWTREYDYYREGWSRGRYAFWKKHIFSELRQDFIYTDRSGSVLEGEIDAEGEYELWVRYLTGGTPGSFQLQIANCKLQITKNIGEERFVWKNLGDVTFDRESQIIITNIYGENAIADVVLVERI